MDLAEYILTTPDPTKEWALRRRVFADTATLMDALKKKLEELSVGSAECTLPVDSTTAIHTFGANFARQILDAGKSIEKTVEILLGKSIAIIGASGTMVCIFPAHSLFLR